VSVDVGVSVKKVGVGADGKGGRDKRAFLEQLLCAGHHARHIFIYDLIELSHQCWDSSTSNIPAFPNMEVCQFASFFFFFFLLCSYNVASVHHRHGIGKSKKACVRK